MDKSQIESKVAVFKLKIQPYINIALAIGVAESELELSYKKNGLVHFGGNKANVCRKKSLFDEVVLWIEGLITSHLYVIKAKDRHQIMIWLLKQDGLFDVPGQPDCWLGGNSPVDNRRVIVDYSQRDDEESVGVSFAGRGYHPCDDFEDLFVNIKHWKKEQERLNHNLNELLPSKGMLLGMYEMYSDGVLGITTAKDGEIYIPSSYNGVPFLFNFREFGDDYRNEIRPCCAIVGSEFKGKDDVPDEVFFSWVTKKRREELKEQIWERISGYQNNL